ncbi:DinB family protein [Nakamurella flavida]|uniref:DinB family protein n=1 Tax=Nakamurella flavida TaxID=363630 RepID=A0A939C0J5_9ACTN|nr:DinB family protein [Nakamurella flavida]MBM9476788.1 DinB family protein [Nakamurella flavida]MDP9778774.1 hypothetical protein [Nakamurella flavida]
MTDEDAVAPSMKADLLRYLQTGRDAVLWKLDGLGEYDARRPLTPTGTNLLGLVKHLAGVEIGYLGDTFGRPFPDPPAWMTAEDGPDDDPQADLFATPDETREDVVGLYRRAWAHGDATVEALDLSSVGQVPWWPPERRDVTLHRVLVHLIAETHRHAGHADIVREGIDGAAGLRADGSNLWVEGDGWPAYRDRVERAAREAAG